MSRLKVGVVGVGVGRLHLKGYQALSDEVEIVALCDKDEARLHEVGDAFDIPLRYTDSQALFTSGKIEAVSICLPNSLHASVSIAALEAGLHVLCEKPLAENVIASQKIVEAAGDAPGKFMLCFNRRYRPDVRWIKACIDTGKLGRIYQIKAGWIRETGIPGWTNWFINKDAAGGGPLIDLGVHILDMVMWLLDYPKAHSISGDVQANFGPHGRKTWHGSNLMDKNAFGVEDSATAFIRLADGIILNLETSWASHTKPGTDDFFITVMGTKGGIDLYVANYAEKDTLTFYTEINGTPVTIKPQVTGNQFDHSYAVAEFVKCIQKDMLPTASAEKGLIIMQMIDAIYRSASTQREIMML